jgi:hypothetical protein
VPLPSDTHRKPITSITAVLLPFVTYLLPLPCMRVESTLSEVCKAWAERGLVYRTKGRIFNNMLYVRYVHLTKDQAYSEKTNPSSRQSGCYIRTMTARVQLKIISGRDPQEASCQDEMVGGKPPDVK